MSKFYYRSVELHNYEILGISDSRLALDNEGSHGHRFAAFFPKIRFVEHFANDVSDENPYEQRWTFQDTGKNEKQMQYTAYHLSIHFPVLKPR